MSKIKQLSRHIEKKANTKQDIYMNTLEAFNLLKKETEYIVEDLRKNMANRKRVIPLIFNDRGDFEFELQFAGDVLIFYMHTNVFDLGRHHETSRTHYVRSDSDRRFCGIIHIYNFLSDSFKYNRYNDSGILIGRVFVNKDKHFFIEGKREMNQAAISFSNDKVSAAKMRNILLQSILCTVNFDLPSPSFENIQEVNVYDFENAVGLSRIKTSKRLGFKFQAEEKKIL